MIRTFALLLLVFSALGCVAARTTVNEPLNSAQLAGLEPGVTTAAEVLELFGAPTDVVQLGRKSAYRYDFQNSKRAGLFLLIVAFLNEDTRTDRMWVFFDERDVLSHYGATFEADKTEYALPWEDIHD